ncbi:Putative metal chaperone, involved in Zn homeostasis, GTPase of COG0523 family [Methanosarcina horonobensis HB-1 = JCM 15518]|uniref:Putative metal chaperone, involved in Zn homeostasis, GTPase of COG0523 family n=1 Tax=Methanosarcina horonobensis HB-1 = JCM 15518 TaxID=1434110 RepID=A0A0E3SIC2_9EURY|nr:GTP-binding protein [Methanosarcina horonobensis]AKB80247.1 Putative metal chaperone, involved in Zn homeostasis, GTPase of COG0523 family [Methanosarcina horonobensis HB-1 = JCM 15518]
MKVMIIGGFLGSGKTTAIQRISRQLSDAGKRTAIIVNEIGEIGLDGETLKSPGIMTQELTSGCICCTLKISMQYTLQTLEEEFKPDIVIIEPTGIAFPGQIREEIEVMGLSELSFAPVVTLVDPGRFGTEAKEIPRFIETQVKEAEILGINKVDVAPAEIVMATEQMLAELNPEARVLKFSAKVGDEQFKDLFIHLALPGIEKPSQEKQNSIEISEVSAHSVLYTLSSCGFNPEEGRQFIEESLQTIRDKVREINPDFIGHVKLSLKLPSSMIKGSVTSSEEAPQVEFIPRKNEKLEIRLLSAITKIPKDKLTGIVESTLEEKLRESDVSFKKKEQQQHGSLTKISGIMKKK